MKKLLLTIALFITTTKTLACAGVVMPSKLNIALDPSNKTSYFYNDEELLYNKPTISLDACSKTAKQDKYLMIAVAIENFILSDDFLTYSINDSDSGAGENCSLDNNLFANVQGSSERRKRLDSKRKFINSCLKVNVTDFSKTGLSIKDNQPGCKVTRVSQYAADFEGAFCFIKPKRDSLISLQFDVKKECLNNDFYKKNNIKFQDVLGIVSLYTAGDDSGSSGDLTNLKQSDFRVSVNTPEHVMATSTYNGDQKPTWPTVWSIPEVYFGKPSANLGVGKVDVLNFPLAVNNVCDTKCVGGLCSSACDYSQPVVGDFAIYEFNKKGKKELLASWFDGGVAPAQWQGLLKGIGVKLPKNILEMNKTYLVEADLSDQELNYLSFKGRIEKMFRMNNVIGEMNRSGTSIQTINRINEIDDLDKLPLIGNINGIYFTGNALAGVQDALGSMNLTFKNTFWPPYFEKTCYGSKCKKQSSFKNKIYLKFKLTGSPTNPKFENVEFSNKSNLVPSKKITNYNFPTRNCGNVADTTDEPIGDDAWDFDF